MIHPLIQAAEQSSLKAPESTPQFQVGDSVDVYYRIIEGKKERLQRFSGDVIQISGRGPTKNFTVRRLVAGEGVERIFPVHSPNVEKVDVKRSGQVRRARLFYLRERVGKATRIADKKVQKPTGAKAGKGAVKKEQAVNKQHEMAEAPQA